MKIVTLHYCLKMSSLESTRIHAVRFCIVNTSEYYINDRKAKYIGRKMLLKFWAELYYLLNVCRVTKGAYI